MVDVAAVVFFECLWLAGLGEAAGLGLDDAVWQKTFDIENAAKAIMRGMSFLMALGLPAAER